MNNMQKSNPVGKPIFLITEGHDNLRKSLCEFIKIVFKECRILETKDGDEAVTQAFAWQPDIVLMGLPVMDGIKTTRRIKAELPQTRVAILAIHESPEYQADATAAGRVLTYQRTKWEMDSSLF